MRAGASWQEDVHNENEPPAAAVRRLRDSDVWRHASATSHKDTVGEQLQRAAYDFVMPYSLTNS